MHFVNKKKRIQAYEREWNGKKWFVIEMTLILFNSLLNAFNVLLFFDNGWFFELLAILLANLLWMFRTQQSKKLDLLWIRL